MAIRSDIAVFLPEVTGPAQFITGAHAAPHPRRVIRHRAGPGTMATSGHGRGGQVRGYVTHGPAADETRGPAVGAAHNPSVGARAAALVSRSDHEPEVRGREGRAVPAGRGVRAAGHRAHRAGARG